MIAILLGMLAAIGFSGAGLLALLGKELRTKSQSYSVAVAAGILLALAFVDLFPEGLELARGPAIIGFIGGFALLFLTETFTSAHMHHSTGEPVYEHPLRSFVLGLAIHNFSDGFVLGIGAKVSAAASGLVGVGVLIHQMPVGISLATVLIAINAPRARVVRTTVLLGLAIPLGAGLTVALPVAGDGVLGFLIGVAGGVLTYVGAAHLLPQAQTAHPSKITGFLFAATLLIATVGLMTFLSD